MKSYLTSFVMLHLAGQGSRVCISSLEMEPEDTLERMVSMYSACKDPTIRMLEAFKKWAGDSIWLYDRVGTVPAARVEALVHYCAVEHDIRHLVIDSMMMCDLDEEDYNSQKQFMLMLVRVSKLRQLNIHLVCHMRKNREGRKQSRNDIFGSSNIANLAQNIFLINLVDKEDGKNEEKPDMYLTLDARRKGSWKGSFALWVHASGQFMGRENWRFETDQIERGALV